MRSRRKIEPESEYTDAELALWAEFAEAVRDGRNPDMEEFLRRLPESADKLRPDLEAAVEVDAALRKLQAAYPNVSLAELLDPGRRQKKE